MTPELIFESISVNYPFNDLVHSINYFAYQFRKVLSKDERYILRKAKDILFVHYDQTQIKKPLILSPCIDWNKAKLLSLGIKRRADSILGIYHTDTGRKDRSKV